MTYTDEDIFSLMDDLEGVGLSETPLEMAERIRGQLGKFKTLKEASEFLSQTRVPHTFYSIVTGNNSNTATKRTNWIMVRGFGIFWERERGWGAYTSLAPRTPDRIRRIIEYEGRIFLSDSHHTDANDLSDSGYI